MPATGVGVYTQNLVYAAPVELDRSRTPSDRIRAVVICSGVANACTGQRGLEDARQMARLAAAACGAKEEQVLVLSTGVIGAVPAHGQDRAGDRRRGGASSATARPAWCPPPAAC